MRKRDVAIFGLAVMLLGAGCEQSSRERVRTSPTFELSYLEVLGELTRQMGEERGAEETLESLRVYVSTHGEEIRSMVNALNRDVLSLDASQREVWRRESRVGVEAGLDAYASSVQRLSRRLTDAQRWELGEILSQLK